MKLCIATSLLAAMPLATAFTATSLKTKNFNLKVATMEETTDLSASPKLYDPLGLYPESSEERRQGLIQPLEEETTNSKKTVRDPLGLYPANSPEFMKEIENEQTLQSQIKQSRPIFDPMNLYSESSPERKEGRIQKMEPPVEIAKDIKDPMGLYPVGSAEFMQSLEIEKARLDLENRAVRDPMNLYPPNSDEYKEGKIKPLEPELKVIKPVLDPLGLYSPGQTENEVDTDAVMSEALPFFARPAYLDGELAGDFGFDPLGLATSKEGLLWQREAELKHSRIAMLAVAGWPLSELFDGKLADVFHMQPLLVEGDRVPSILNGGLASVNPFYWMGVLAVAGLFEAVNGMNKDAEISRFDPFGLFPKEKEGQMQMELAEVKHGRIAMMAITAFAAIEAVTQKAIVDVAPFFFHPPF